VKRARAGGGGGKEKGIFAVALGKSAREKGGEGLECQDSTGHICGRKKSGRALFASKVIL